RKTAPAENGPWAAADGALAAARRRTPPPCEGLAGLRYKYQGSSATVTNPGLNPVETNAKLAGYHQVLNPSNLTTQYHCHAWRNRRCRSAPSNNSTARADTPAPPVSTFYRATYY